MTQDRVKSFGLVPPAQSHLELPVACESIPAGFPSPNGGYIDGNLINSWSVILPRPTSIRSQVTR